MQISHDLPPKLPPGSWTSIDLELFNAEKKKLHRPTTGTFACLSICYNPDLVYVLIDVNQVKNALFNLEEAVWIFHNAAFDITHLRRWAYIPPRKKIWDCMIIERDMCGGLYELFSLEDVVRRRLNLRMNKEIRDTFEKTTQLTSEQIEYAANDALMEWMICQAQKKEITKSEYKIWTNVDRPALWAMLDFQGFRLDDKKWLELADKNKAKTEEIKAQLPFNPASPIQVKKALIMSGFKGLKSTEVQYLQNMMLKKPEAKAVDFAQQVLEYRKYAKRTSTYGHKFVENYLEQEGSYGIIHAGYWVTGAETGRSSSSNPNMQNIIARDTNEFRECFIARPQHKLVIADMGQQELRIATYFSQDKALLKILQNKERDPFVGMAELIYKKTIKENDSFRKQTKNTTYGITYGMTPEGMADRYDMTVEDAQRSIGDFFNAFPELYSWIIQQQKKRDYVETAIGRKIYLNPHSDQVERNAVNSPIQGTAADQMKVALGNIYEKWDNVIGIDALFCCVGYVHDELILDEPVRFAERIGQFITKEMVDAAEAQCPGVPFVSDYIIAQSWADKES